MSKQLNWRLFGWDKVICVDTNRMLAISLPCSVGRQLSPHCTYPACAKHQISFSLYLCLASRGAVWIITFSVIPKYSMLWQQTTLHCSDGLETHLLWLSDKLCSTANLDFFKKMHSWERWKTCERLVCQREAFTVSTILMVPGYIHFYWEKLQDRAKEKRAQNRNMNMHQSKSYENFLCIWESANHKSRLHLLFWSLC